MMIVLVEDLDEVRDRVGHRARSLPTLVRRSVGMVIRRVLRRRRYAPRVDVVLVDRLRHPIDRLEAEPQRLRDLATCGPRAVRDDVADHRGVALAVLLVDVLDDFLAIVRRDVEVDVRHRPRVLGEKAFEEKVVLDRVDLGDVEDVRDDRVRGRSPALRGDPVLLAEANDVPVDQEELREAASVDDVELVRELLRDIARDPRVLDPRALAAERVEEGERGVSFGHRETRKTVLSDERCFRARRVRVVQEVEHAGIGDLASVAERLVEAAEPFAQHGLALEPVLAVRLEAVPGLVERDAEVDAAEHVVETAPFGARVMDVVRDDAAKAHLPGKRCERVAERRRVGVEVVRELDVEPLAEHSAEPCKSLARRGEIARADRARHRAIGAAGEREEARGVLGEELEGRFWLRLLAGELGRRDHSAEAGPALTVAGDEDDVTHVLELELRAEDRTESPLFRGVGEPHSPVQAIRVGESERI